MSDIKNTGKTAKPCIRICARCPKKGLRAPATHSGYTSKSGPSTWWRCTVVGEYFRAIKQCAEYPAAIAATKAQCPHWFDKNQSSYYTDGGYRRYKSTKKPPTGGKEASDGK